MKTCGAMLCDFGSRTLYAHHGCIHGVMPTPFGFDA